MFFNYDDMLFYDIPWKITFLCVVYINVLLECIVCCVLLFGCSLVGLVSFVIKYSYLFLVYLDN